MFSERAAGSCSSVGIAQNWLQRECWITTDYVISLHNCLVLETKKQYHNRKFTLAGSNAFHEAHVLVMTVFDNCCLAMTENNLNPPTTVEEEIELYLFLHKSKLSFNGK